MRQFLVALVFSLSPTWTFAGPADVARDATQNYIIPAYEALENEARNTGRAFEELCITPSANNLNDAKNQFSLLVEAWSRIDFIRFGPVLKNNRIDRLVFWPDRQGIGLRQVQRILDENDTSVLSVNTLINKSVAVQGLGALEFVLFGTSSENLSAEGASFRCEYGRSISQQIARIAEQVVAEWSDAEGIGSRLISPNSSFNDYRSTNEVLAELVGIWAHGAELIRDTRLSPMLNSGLQTARPKSALFWRSGLTFQSIAWMTEGMSDLLDASSLGDELSQDRKWAMGSLQLEFENFTSTAHDLVQVDTSEGVTVILTEDGWARANYLVGVANSILQIINDVVAPNLGLAIGFSALDGD